MSKFHHPELSVGTVLKTKFATDSLPGVRPMTPGYFKVTSVRQSYFVKFPCMKYELFRCTKVGRVISKYVHAMDAAFIDGKIAAGEAEVFTA